MVKLTRLRAIRQRAALSQQELADLAGLSRIAVVRIEAGAAEPYPSTIRKLAAALNVEPHQLMEPMSGEVAA